MSTRTITALVVLLVLFAAGGVAYLVNSQQEVTALKQRVAELSQELAQTRSEQHSPQQQQTAPSYPVALSPPPLKSAVKASDADVSLSEEGEPLKQAVLHSLGSLTNAK